MASADHDRIVGLILLPGCAHAMTCSHFMTALRANTLTHSSKKLELNSKLFSDIVP
jgi:hypothetical protein